MLVWNKDCWVNIDNLTYGDDTTLMPENEEELKSLLIKVKEGSEKVGLKPNIRKDACSLKKSYYQPRQHI